MLFFPFRADITLSGIPVFTIFILILCLTVYWQQAKSDNSLMDYTGEFCEKKNSRMDKIIMRKITDTHQGETGNICPSLYLTIFQSSEPENKIAEISSLTAKFSTKSLQKSHLYINKYLTKNAAEFNANAPESLSTNLSYKPESFNVITMITSAFAHGSWSHVIGNLFFFFAFATTIEAIVGLVFFPLIVVTLAIGTNVVYSLAVMASPDALPTLGLSGVVMGVMGLFTYFIPTAKIRCFFWFFIIVKRFGVPAWILAMWFFGWDLYDLNETGTSSGVNLVAHVSGFILGYLLGFSLFGWRKKEVHAAIRRGRERGAMQGVLKN